MREKEKFFVFGLKTFRKGRGTFIDLRSFCFNSSATDSESESGSHKSIRGKQSGPSDGKPTRVRTVLNEKQLHTLR